MRNAQFRVNIDRPDAFRGFKAPRLRSVARYGDRPCANVFRRLKVAIVLVAALLAAEVQALPVRCRDVAAGTAPTACVTRADRLQLNPDCRRLVFNFESHIGVRPSVDFGTEVFPLTQRTVSKVLQVLHHDFSCSDFNRVADQCLGAHMREMGGYGSLVSRHSAKQASGRLGANRLDSRTGAADTRTTVIQFTTVEEKWFGVCGVGGDKHSLHAHVHTDNTTFGFGFWNLHLMRKDQIPLLTDTFEFGIFPPTVRERPRIFNNQKLSPKCDAFFGAVEIPLPNNRQHGASKLCQPPTVVGLCRFVGGTDGLTEGTGQLRGQTHLPEVGVVGFCQPIRVQLLGLENKAGKPVRRLEPSSEQSVSLRAAGNLELDYANCFHYIKDYHQEKTMSTELRRNNHSVSRLLVHLVFVVKYRHAVISDSVWTSLRYGFDLAAKRLDLVLVEANHDKDHAHLVVEYPPKVSISEMVNALKGNSSFVARRDCKEELRKKLWGSAFWSPSFFAASCGGAPIETLKLYVQSQQTKAALKGRVSTQKF